MYAKLASGLVLGYLVLLILVATLVPWFLNRGNQRAARFLNAVSNFLVFQNRYQRRSGMMHSLLDDPQKADRLWEELRPHLNRLGIGPSHALASNYAAALIRDGRYRQAVQLLERTDIFYPPNSEGMPIQQMMEASRWINLACAHNALGQVSEARACLDKGWKVAPVGLVTNYLSLVEASLCQSQDDYDGARFHLNAIVARLGGPCPSIIAFRWASLGYLEEAQALLPETPPQEPRTARYCYFLTKAVLSEDPEPLLWEALKVELPAGELAWQALRLLGAERARPFVARAKDKDPENHWTGRCESEYRSNGAKKAADDCEEPGLQAQPASS